MYIVHSIDFNNERTLLTYTDGVDTFTVEYIHDVDGVWDVNIEVPSDQYFEQYTIPKKSMITISGPVENVIVTKL
jgi:hypothetical protein